MNVTLNGCGSSEMIDILVNGEVLVEKYWFVNSGHLDEQSFSIPVRMLRAGTYNRLVIRLNKESRESYWLPDLIIFYSVVTNDIWIDTNNSEKYIELKTSEDYRNGRPYKIFSTPERSRAHFMIHLPDKKPAQEVTLTLNHCKTTCGGSIDILVNGKEHLMNYDGAWWKDFQEQTFPIPEKILKTGVNVLTVRLNEGSRGVYWLSDVKIQY
ncbi:uncharacterized protein LOC134231821 [Saccostrea cucullata]|uniref:uncharacterized protein LOC134231821 n=1 Tax=Saccostrea cuccullata TaxID=36930 RepID=UPI002ED4A67D